jgi:predicted Zn-dependent protease
MQSYFHEVADALTTLLHGAEIYTATFAAEESDFVRFNRGAIRQAGTVVQRSLAVDLIEGRRHAAGTLSLSGDLDLDGTRLRTLVDTLRAQRAQLPDDPYLLYATDVHASERLLPNRLPEAAAAVDEIERGGRARDLVGIYAAGGLHSGFANSLGQRNWQTTYSYNFDWSFYHAADKAVKENYAGFEWDSAAFAHKVELAAERLAVVGRAPHTIRPGRYRVYLSPAALYDLIGLLGWGGFGLRAHRTKTTPLIKMIEDGARLHPSVHLIENTRDGIAPSFQAAGFIRPDRVPLLQGGAYAETLVSPRSAVEFGAVTNGASAGEAPQSVDLAAGTLPRDDVLKALHTGVYVGNLWYLNYSDRTACRTTGMTRFATFWVANGQIQAPLNVMRFDETFYRMLGDNLIALTAEQELLFDPDTYGQRSTATARLPGALIDDFTFTL